MEKEWKTNWYIKEIKWSFYQFSSLTNGYTIGLMLSALCGIRTESLINVKCLVHLAVSFLKCEITGNAHQAIPKIYFQIIQLDWKISNMGLE